MEINDFVNFYFDHDRFRKKIMEILEENNLTITDIAPSIGYADRTLFNYLKKYQDSRFIAGALCERFNLNPKNFMRDN